jgi:hypothetical protein
MNKLPDHAYVTKYGLRFNPLCDSKGKPVMPRPEWMIERDILTRYDFLQKNALNPELLLPWTEHFMNFVSAIWDRKETKYRFTWNPYAVRMLEEAANRRLLGISGHASSGKSQFAAIWGLANFLLYPDTTKVLITSTSLQESRMRVWGVVEKYWEEARSFIEGNYRQPMPGKLVSSSGKIVGMTSGKADDLTGLTLIAGGKGQDGDASTKIGFKSQGKLILMDDELPLLTHKLYDAVTNLMANDGFQMIGTGNLTSIFDPFGLFVEPAGGWDTVTEDTFGWDTKVGGYCVRFDGELSPNVKAEQVIYPGLLSVEGLREIKERWGYRSPGYYRMVKSFPCPTGIESTVYSEPELTKNLAMQKGSKWLELPTPLAFLDPAFSKGGDRAAAAFGLLGWVRDEATGQRVQCLEKTDTVDLMMRVNARHATKDRNEQLADLYIEECSKRNIAVQDRGLDVTGGGDPFSTIMAMKMGHGLCRVSFAGAASDRPVSATDKRKGKERFANRVTELWYVGKDFLATGQLKGLDATTMQEMCARTFKEQGNRVLVEPKDDMKKRTNGRSPDYADAFFGLLDVARTRHNFLSGAKAKMIAQAAPTYTDPRIAAVMSSPTPARRAFSFVESHGDFSSGWGDSD